MESYAHTKDGSQPEQWQRLEEHLGAVSRLAGGFCSHFGFGARAWGEAVGLLHDVGKLDPAFQAYLFKQNQIEPNPFGDHWRGKTQHAIEGSRCAWSQFRDGFGRVMAFVVAGHHRGLPDALPSDRSADANLQSYLKRPAGLSYDDTFQQLDLAVDVRPQADLPIWLDQENKQRRGFQIQFFIRMLFSALVDADFLDTERFLEQDKSEARTDWPKLVDLAEVFFPELDALTKDASESVVNGCRREILEHCLKAAHQRCGLFSLTVPTGGGKTLSSLAFAFDHARKHGLKRVIYAIPFTSIIEQNAEVFRQFLGDDAVLEHHSNTDSGSADWRHRLAAENWDAPLVVTTNVQLFDSLFANRPSRCRKLHNLAGSVIVLDEIQALPVEKLAPCLEALRELATNYGSTVVLCSATQPAIQRRQEFPSGLEDVHEIIPEPDAYFTRMKRTTVESLATRRDEEIVDLLQDHQQVLVIVNTRNHAQDLYTEACEQLGDADVVHLSALMCPRHRQDVLKEIYSRLDDDQPCRVISTSLVEAGVDIDFPVVVRAMAGLDSIAQAAGRCNREGNLDVGWVYVFEPAEVHPRGDINRRTSAAREVFEGPIDDPLSPQAITGYFRLYYWLNADQMDRLEILKRCGRAAPMLDFPFEQIARFALIESDMRPVVIEYDSRASQLAAELTAQGPSRRLFRQLQPYLVQIYDRQYKALLRAGIIEALDGGFALLCDRTHYSDKTGLTTDFDATRNPEDLVI